MLVELRPFTVLDGLPGLFGLKYDCVTACGLPLYLCSYKLVGSATPSALAKQRTRHTRPLQCHDPWEEWGKVEPSQVCLLMKLPIDENVGENLEQPMIAEDVYNMIDPLQGVSMSNIDSDESDEDEGANASAPS